MPATILIIEDTWANLELARYLLEAAGHEVLVATDGASGVTLALARRPALVLCDLQMPILDGYAVLERLRLELRAHETRIIAFTAYSMSGDREKVLSAGFDGYVSKPIDPATFAARIEGWLPAAGGGSAADRPS